MFVRRKGRIYQDYLSIATPKTWAMMSETMPAVTLSHITYATDSFCTQAASVTDSARQLSSHTCIHIQGGAHNFDYITSIYYIHHYCVTLSYIYLLWILFSAQLRKYKILKHAQLHHIRNTVEQHCRFHCHLEHLERTRICERWPETRLICSFGTACHNRQKVKIRKGNGLTIQQSATMPVICGRGSLAVILYFRDTS